MANKLDALRQLIREEVALAVRTEIKLAMQELKPLLEGKTTPSKSTVSKNSLVESIKPVTKPETKIKQTSTGDPIADLLNETKYSMQPDDYRSIGNFGAQDAPGFGMIANQVNLNHRETVVTENVSDILQAARPAGDVSGVQLPDAVPDFTNLMQSLKSKGQI